MEKRTLASLIFSLLLAITFFAPGCFVQKKQREATVESSRGNVFQYTYREHLQEGKVGVAFYLIKDRFAEPSEILPISEREKSDITGFPNPALKIVVTPPLFAKESHADKLEMVLYRNDLEVSEGVDVKGLDEVISLKAGAELLLPLSHDFSADTLAVAFSLLVTNEAGKVLPKGKRSVQRHFPIKNLTNDCDGDGKKDTQGPCPQIIITGKVMDDWTQRPMEEVEVTLETELSEDRLLTDWDGAFRIKVDTTGASPEIILKIEQPGYLAEVLTIDRSSVVPGQELQIYLRRLEPLDISDEKASIGEDEVEEIPEESKDPSSSPGSSEKPSVSPVQPPAEGDKSMPTKTEEALWQEIQTSEDHSDFEEYLKLYPQGKHRQEAQQKLQESYQNAVKGLLEYYVPDTMVLNAPHLIRVVITSDTSDLGREKAKEAFEGIVGPPPSVPDSIVEALIKISEVMRAELRDPSPAGDKRFFIDPPGKKEQIVDLYTGDPTVWNWTVTPLTKGKHSLNIIVEVLFEKDGQYFPKAEEQVFTVSVVVEPSFFSQNLGWLLTTAMLLLAGLLAIWLWRRRKQKQMIQLAVSYNQLTALVAQNRLDTALDMLADALRDTSDKYFGETVIYQSRLSDLEENINKGIISTDAAALEENKIRNSVLSMLSRIRRNFHLES